MTIRRENADDYDRIWDIFSAVVKTGDTYIFGPDTPKEALGIYWLGDRIDTFVAITMQR